MNFILGRGNENAFVGTGQLLRAYLMPSPAIEPGDVRTSKLQRCLPGALSLGGERGIFTQGNLQYEAAGLPWGQ